MSSEGANAFCKADIEIYEMNPIYHFQIVGHFAHGGHSLDQLPEKIALHDRPARRITFIVQPVMGENGVATRGRHARSAFNQGTRRSALPARRRLPRPRADSRIGAPSRQFCSDDTLMRAGIEQLPISTCGINPPAGENRLFGYGEKEEKIMPAVAVLRECSWDVEGQLHADTLFFRAGCGDVDMVMAMYHEQGHRPVKVVGLQAGVNVVEPVIRTSVDHGTAFDSAGKGIADEGSMLKALKRAEDLTTRRADDVSAHERPLVGL